MSFEKSQHPFVLAIPLYDLKKSTISLSAMRAIFEGWSINLEHRLYPLQITLTDNPRPPILTATATPMAKTDEVPDLSPNRTSGVHKLSLTSIARTMLFREMGLLIRVPVHINPSANGVIKWVTRQKIVLKCLLVISPLIVQLFNKKIPNGWLTQRHHII